MSDKAVQPTRQPPEGFVPIKNMGGFNDVIEPAFARFTEDGVDFGFFVEKKHCNPMGTCHGGMLMTFVDIMLGGYLCRRVGKFVGMPTININCDFLAAPVVGDWLQSEIHFLHFTASVGYVSGSIIGPQGTVLRASGAFKVPKDVIELAKRD